MIKKNFSNMNLEINSVLKGLNISNDRYVYIKSYIRRMIKDYKGRPLDIIKEIPLNLKGNERYFATFYVGKSLSKLFSEMSMVDKTDFLVNITKGLKLEDNRVEMTADYISDIIRKQMADKIPKIDVIKLTINSKLFIDIEKDYLIFILGLI